MAKPIWSRKQCRIR